MNTTEMKNPIAVIKESSLFTPITDIKNARVITAEELYELNKDYNPSAWRNVINSYLKYDNIKFFFVPEGNGYGYNRFFAIYTTRDNITFFASISYSSGLTNGGFSFIRYNENENGEVAFERGMMHNFRLPNNDITRNYVSQLEYNSGIILTTEY